MTSTDTPFPAARSPRELAERLEATGYIGDEPLATVGFLALALQRPLFLEGEPGTGKTALAEALAQGLGVPLIRLQCYEGIDATQALYDWDFPRQILHLRALEAYSSGRAQGSVSASTAGTAGLDEIERGLFDERFLLERPILKALRQSPSVLLIDEIDRADDEFEAFLLEVLSTYRVSVPELGTVEALIPPVVVLTSNRTRDVHDALKRRCLYHWLEHPTLEREISIVRRRIPSVSEELARQVVDLVQRLRTSDLIKPPGVSETLDWIRALMKLDVERLDLEAGTATLGAAIKQHDDASRASAVLRDALEPAVRHYG